MVQIAQGNLLEAPVEALVNTVNTQGIMGKGIALQFKQAFPEMFRDYEKACKAGEVRLGKVHVYDLGGLTGGPRWIINFPTKGHWRERSRLADIEVGLQDLSGCNGAAIRRSIYHSTAFGVWQWRIELGRRSSAHRGCFCAITRRESPVVRAGARA
ncbi:MAG: macro domain-containing protein [Candidatus Binatia bacterium]